MYLAPFWRQTEILSRHSQGAPMFVYVFTHPSPDYLGNYGQLLNLTASAHGSDLVFLFGPSLFEKVRTCILFCSLCQVVVYFLLFFNFSFLSYHNLCYISLLTVPFAWRSFFFKNFYGVFRPVFFFQVDTRMHRYLFISFPFFLQHKNWTFNFNLKTQCHVIWVFLFHFTTDLSRPFSLFTQELFWDLANSFLFSAKWPDKKCPFLSLLIKLCTSSHFHVSSSIRSTSDSQWLETRCLSFPYHFSVLVLPSAVTMSQPQKKLEVSNEFPNALKPFLFSQSPHDLFFTRASPATLAFS